MNKEEAYIGMRVKYIGGVGNFYPIGMSGIVVNEFQRGLEHLVPVAFPTQPRILYWPPSCLIWLENSIL